MLYTTSGQNGLAFCLARLRQQADTFGDRVIIADGIPAPPDGAAAAMRFGPEGKVFVAFDDGGNPHLGSDWSSNGKVLRLNADGTTPSDQRVLPLYASAYRSPRGLAWHIPSKTLWILTQEAAGGRLDAITSDRAPHRGHLQATIALPDAVVPSGLAVYPGVGVAEALRGNILIASETARLLLRLRVDPHIPTQILGTEELLRDRIGAIRAPVVGVDGAIYVATEHTIWRLSPQAAGNIQRPWCRGRTARATLTLTVGHLNRQS